MFEFSVFWRIPNASLLCIPSAIFFLGGIVGRVPATGRVRIQRAWSAALLASAAALLFAVWSCTDAFVHAGAIAHAPRINSLFCIGNFGLSFRLDFVSVLMLLLVTFLGWIITNYSRAYMSGDAEESRYVGNLMWTLSAVSLLVVTNNLIVFLAAWVLTSLTLHRLLTLYPHRQPAVIAAHKKFLASRLGDLTLLGAVILLWSQTGSFEMNEVARHVVSFGVVPAAIHVAALLLAVSAIIQCAQLPLHGWLIQVMEAPTPVSALLHAGVVNLGGFLLIRVASILSRTPSANALLVVGGCMTAIISSMVMTTRISIKVHLAWSTCAQMGFMLMECGLGLYGLALLHLLAHSLYKAHAFLGSGGVVRQARTSWHSAKDTAGSGGVLMASACAGILIAAIGAVSWSRHEFAISTSMFGITIVGFAIAGLISAAFRVRDGAASPLLLVLAGGVSALYFGYDAAFDKVVTEAETGVGRPFGILPFVLVCFTLLYLVQGVVRRYPSGRIATVLYPWFYAGLYMDELFTRATFRIWPASHAARVSQRRDAIHPFTERGVSR